MSLLNLKMHLETAKVVFFELHTPWFRVKQDWGNIIIPYASLQCQLWSYQVYWWFINPGCRRWQQCQLKYSKKMIFLWKLPFLRLIYLLKIRLLVENRPVLLSSFCLFCENLIGLYQGYLEQAKPGLPKQVSQEPLWAILSMLHPMEREVRMNA